MNRDEMIQNEQRRQQEFEQRRAELQKEFSEIATPVLEFKAIERRMTEIQHQLASLTNSNSAIHAEYMRSLEHALPKNMPAMIQAARSELGQRQREPSAAMIARMAELRDWLDAVDEARRDESKTSADLLVLTDRGKELGLTGAVKAFDDPPFVRA